MGQHANTYLLLFSHPYLVESLLRDFAPAKWACQLDFSSLEKVGSSYATDDLRSRHDDLIWKVRSRLDGRWIYIYLLLEFQRQDEYFMAVRIMSYVGLLYQDLIRQQRLKRGAPLPLVLPIVLYNGHARWKSPTNVATLVPEVPVGLEVFRPSVEYLLLDEGAFPAQDLKALPGPAARLFRLEHAGPEDLLAEVKRLRQSLRGPEHQELRRAFVIAILAILRRRLQGIRLPETRELKEVETMLVEQAPTWTEMWKQQGLREGESTMLLRQLETRFGPLDKHTRERVAGADAERLLEWGERILRAESLADVFGD